MTPDYIRLRPEWTIAQALEHLRRFGRDAETINVVYVADEHGKLIDDIRLRQILLSKPDDTVESIMNRQFVSLRADQPQEEAVELLQRYDRVALPVVDSRGVLLGIVTHDDVADVAQQQATEEIQRIGGVQALEEPYMATSIPSLVKKRLPWLALLFLSELLTSNAIAFFEDEIKRAAILAAFVPAIISSGGNAGSQASTLTIRALGLKEIDVPDWWRVLRRELIVSFILGFVIGCIGFIRITIFGAMGWFHDEDVLRHYSILAGTIGATLVGVILWGSVMGSMLPFLLKKLRFDPATSCTPFVATLVDVTGIVIYFSLALVILRTTLLAPPTHDDVPFDAGMREVIVESSRRDPDDKDFVQIEVRPEGVPPATTRIRVPLTGLPDSRPPAPGARIRVYLQSREASRVEAIAP
jgi:magnesium transporter